MEQMNLIDWSPEKITEFQDTFLTWYHREKRQLPWREYRDPYAIWISEIMLQQTRVETVIDYYYRFMERFPTIADLAKAPDEMLLKIWEGLGYYSRARNLKIAAQQIMTDFGGEFPQTVAEIQTLKGIGPYTTGAIASIAFQLPEPAIDGNVMRVTSRLFGIDEDIAKPKSRKVFDYFVRTILSPSEPGEMNQAFMDLGSRVCTPTSPECSACPLQSFCYAYQTDQPTTFPIKSKKVKPKDVYYVAGAIENSQQEFLLEQRAETGLLANMWLFPLEEVSKEKYEWLNQNWQQETTEQLSLDLVAEEENPPIFEALPVIWQTRHAGEILHVFSHLKWHILLFYGRSATQFTIERSSWSRMDSFANYVFPKPQQKLVEQLEKNQKQ